MAGYDDVTHYQGDDCPGGHADDDASIFRANFDEQRLLEANAEIERLRAALTDIAGMADGVSERIYDAAHAALVLADKDSEND